MAAPNRRYRVEKDSMGFVKVPIEANYGAQTQRAVENFPISGLRFQKELIYTLGLIKYAAAKTNADLRLLDRKRAGAIQRVSEEVMEGMWDQDFVLDVFQTGSGTSTNMNANEVIANRANEILGGKKGIYRPVHPNDHVNLGQSSNDVFPSAIHIACVILLQMELVPALRRLHKTLKAKEKAFLPILKIGRTHLQDATPIRLGQEFGGYARQVERGIDRIRSAVASLSELPLGGTAVGTGINTHPYFARKVISVLNRMTGCRFREALNHFEAQGARDASVETSGPNQNGAPVRLVVPWKYGFKSGKSLVRIRFTDRQPATAWNKAAPNEYGFYSNANPLVDHPRWSQATERRIGEDGLFAKRRNTLMFNGYEAQVGQLYAGMDLKKNFCKTRGWYIF